MTSLRRLLGAISLLLLTATALAVIPTSPSVASSDVAPHDGDHVLVAFEPGTPGHARSSAHAQQGGEVENTFEWLNLDVVEIPRGRSPVEASAAYERNPNVAYAHPNWVVSLSQKVPNDAMFDDLWGIHNTGQTGGTADQDIDGPEAWDTAFPDAFPSSGGTEVGIVDTGIERSHPDLSGKTSKCANATSGIGVVINGSCSDDNGHGTHVAGTIGAITDNGIGVAGVAPDASFAVVKALNAAGTGFYADIIAAIHWLHTRNVPVISMSIGGPQSDSLDQELSEAAADGTLLVAAAGNTGDASEEYPAYHPDVVSVAATDHHGDLADFSTCNDGVDIAAPGEAVLSTFPGGLYATLSGTSMATPHVSGVAAMLMSENGLSADQTRSSLTSTDVGSVCNGAGVVNLAAALGSSGGGGGGGGGGGSEPSDPIGDIIGILG